MKVNFEQKKKNANRCQILSKILFINLFTLLKIEMATIYRFLDINI